MQGRRAIEFRTTEGEDILLDPRAAPVPAGWEAFTAASPKKYEFQRKQLQFKNRETCNRTYRGLFEELGNCAGRCDLVLIL